VVLTIDRKSPSNGLLSLPRRPDDSSELLIWLWTTRGGTQGPWSTELGCRVYRVEAATVIERRVLSAVGGVLYG
jgi:hypothetical protein